MGATFWSLCGAAQCQDLSCHAVFQHREDLKSYCMQVLAYGIASAAILRLIVIGLGTELVDNFQVVNLGFAAFLIFNAWQLVTAGEGPEEDLADKWIVKACRYHQLHQGSI